MKCKNCGSKRFIEEPNGKRCEYCGILVENNESYAEDYPTRDIFDQNNIPSPSIKPQTNAEVAQSNVEIKSKTKVAILTAFIPFDCCYTF